MMTTATSNTTIRDTTIVFTDNKTSIGAGLQQTGYGLIIKVTPSTDGNNIACIDITYNGRHHGQISDPEIFEALVTSLRTTGSTLLERITNYLDNLPNEEFQVIIQQYGLYIEDGIVIDGIIAGIAAYLVLLFLNEQHVSSLISFTFLAPTDLQSGNTVNRNMFRVLTVPLAAMLRGSNKVTIQLASFVSSFINIWDSLFTDGPMMPEVNDIRIAIDIIGQLTQNISLTLDEKVRSYINNKVNEIVEQRLQHYTNEFNKAIVELAEVNVLNAVKNSPKYSSVISETIYEGPNTSEVRSATSIDDVSNDYRNTETSDNTTKVTSRLTQRNDHYTAQPTKIQSTGRLSSPLPWRK